MYAKVFSQIFDSSIADDYHLRHFFMDLLVLADQNGVVDMTPTAISARTRIPLAEVAAMLLELESPDAESRTPDADGRRIARLDEHRTWGWHIINYAVFREIATEEQRRLKTRIRVARFKLKIKELQPGNAPVTQGNAPVTPPYAYASASVSESEIGDARGKGMPATEKEAADALVTSGVPPSFAIDLFNQCEGRGWVEGTGQPISSWPHYAKHRWSKEQQKLEQEKKNGTNSPNRKSHADRNIGTANAGTSHLYKGHSV